MPALQIYDRRERALVAAGDALLRVAAVVGPRRSKPAPGDVRRVLLLRLERIGDLLMTIAAIADARAAWPNAEIHLVVGSWNREIAAGIPGVTHVVTLDAGWLSRDGTGRGLPAMLREAASWRRARFDLAINFEPDVRSNLLLAASGARWRAGYRSGGGGPLLDHALDYDPRVHTADNARRLVASVLDRGVPTTAPPPLIVPETARQRAAALLRDRPIPRVAMHVPGGRPIKQWPPERFADVANRLIADRGATIVLTGSPADRALLNAVRAVLPASHVLDASDADLITVAALLEASDLMVTGDTGPMHLAAAVGTPIVAVFGPSDPARYAPRGPLDRVVRVDLPCAPCNRIRLPPARCVGHTPDCLALVGADRVLEAALHVLDARAPRLLAGRETA